MLQQILPGVEIQLTNLVTTLNFFFFVLADLLHSSIFCRDTLSFVAT